MALVHADAYRLGDATDPRAEIDDLDLDASVDDSVTVVEWGEGLVEQLVDAHLRVRIDRRDDDTRHRRAGPDRRRLGRAARRPGLGRRLSYPVPRVRGSDPRCERFPMPDDAPALDLLALLPEQWRAVLTPHLDPARTAALGEFVAREYATQTVFPPLEDLFSAYRLCPPQGTRVLILGQDPYHRAGQAHGLSFSVRDGVTVPPSLRNVFKELGEDVGVPKPRSGNLDGWAARACCCSTRC